MSSDGLSRMSWMSGLYATPSTSTWLPLTALPTSFSASWTFCDPPARHVGVDLAREFDKARGVAERLHLPRQVERVDRDAVTAQAGAGRESHKAERLGRCRVDDLPGVEPELVAHDEHLVDEADVDRPERVLQELHHLGRLRTGDRHERLDGDTVERRRRLDAGRRDAAHHLGRVARRKVVAARVDPLRAERQEKVLAADQPACFERRQDDLARRPRIGRRFEHDDLAGPQVLARSRRSRLRCTTRRGRASCSAASARRSRSRRPRRGPRSPPSRAGARPRRAAQRSRDGMSSM